ncbi:hypothetical protein [Sporomusa acidovorans]|uniref:Hexokinase n=1 Tax=Sporomusa acidovorans (strain ATCC 49682 / DSM 3132 / Mol) TaxID=1123286 RepID=A0ABZ3J5D9_SPOA4|nr:hypothetical protein [Sporomusa acidovorans]OZC19498.1 hexokinase [Sporomusa acidovorans DSM 3132]SDF75222.1 hexokinase [Sporomusa acidovorans]
MRDLSKMLAGIEENFAIPTSLMKTIATQFKEAMADGLTGNPSSLKMLPSFIGPPTGREQKRVVAVDFGGTNVRVLLVELTGLGQTRIIKKHCFPLKDKQAHYDYTAASSSGLQLFDFIAEKIAEVAPRKDKVYPLGHTFSFPCRQYGVNEAELISWTKEIKTAGVEGRDVGQLLAEALKRKGVDYVTSQAVINDTTGTLLASAYHDNTTDIAAICGTGHNSCYIESRYSLTGKPMIINMESGNFNKVNQTKYDLCLDQASEKPGAQRLEKMASGQYLGEIVRLIIRSLVQEGYMNGDARALSYPYSLPTEDLSAVLADTTPGLEVIAEITAGRWGLGNLTIDELRVLRMVARVVAVRSARLVASTWAGVLGRIDPELSRRHSIAVDGSLYEKMPGYAGFLTQGMIDFFGTKAEQITIKLSKDGSGIGAAIAAAIVYNEIIERII